VVVVAGQDKPLVAEQAEQAVVGLAEMEWLELLELLIPEVVAAVAVKQRLHLPHKMAVQAVQV
jgi:hypothetical protein